MKKLFAALILFGLSHNVFAEMEVYSADNTFIGYVIDSTAKVLINSQG